MVSLAAVEEWIDKLWPDIKQGVIVVESELKGEQLTLVTEKKDAKMQDIITFFRANGLSELWVPKTIIVMQHVPLLGSGKFDYVTARETVLGMRKNSKL